MDNVTWVIQTNLLNDVQMLSVWNSALELGCSVREAIVIPFQDEFGNEDELQKIDVEGTVIIPYGSCKLTRISNERGWRGNCFNPRTFDMTIWNRRRNDMLNSGAHFMKVKDTSSFLDGIDDDMEWFIRPIHDLKQFNGTVARVGDIKDWMNSTKSGNFSFGEDTEIALSPLQTLYSESRYFVVDGKVVDGSYYRIGGRLVSVHITQAEALDAAQEKADGWLPHECCVMDLAETDDGLKVIEFNSINSSGFYDHDVKKIVTAMTEWAARKN